MVLFYLGFQKLVGGVDWYQYTMDLFPFNVISDRLSEFPLKISDFSEADYWLKWEMPVFLDAIC